jgi:two-component system response regulator
LLVEDSPSDAGLTRAALKNAEAAINVHLVKDGKEGMRFLQHGDGHASVPRPDIILLNLNMPKKDGREVLADIRKAISM